MILIRPEKFSEEAFVAEGLFLFAPLSRPKAQDRDFGLQGFENPDSLLALNAGAEKLGQSLSAEAIHSPCRAGQLVGVAAPLDHERLADQGDRSVLRDAQPEIIVFADREALVKSPNASQEIPRHHDRGRADQAEIQAGAEDITGGLPVPFSRIHARAVSQPDLLGLAYLDLGMGLHVIGLNFELGRPPQIV
jgi:hypothetical protein